MVIYRYTRARPESQSASSHHMPVFFSLLPHIYMYETFAIYCKAICVTLHFKHDTMVRRLLLRRPATCIQLSPLFCTICNLDYSQCWCCCAGLFITHQHQCQQQRRMLFRIFFAACPQSALSPDHGALRDRSISNSQNQIQKLQVRGACREKKSIGLLSVRRYARKNGALTARHVRCKMLLLIAILPVQRRLESRE